MKFSKFLRALFYFNFLFIGQTLQLEAVVGMRAHTGFKPTHKPTFKPAHAKINPAVAGLTKRHCGAGVIPYCFHNGQLMFLIGKEGSGHAKDQWADFGGGFDARKDKNSFDTAIREGTEETRYIFGHGNFNQSRLFLGSHITYVIYTPNGKYAIAMVKVNYIPAHVFKNGPKVAHWEKTDYEWVSAHVFLNSLKNSDRFGHKTIRSHIASALRRNARTLHIL